MYQDCGFEGGNINMDVRELLEQVKSGAVGIEDVKGAEGPSV